MNQDQIVGQWKQLKGKIKQKWARMTDDELDLIKGKQEEFAGRVQERYGISKEQAHKDIDDFIESL